MSKRVMTYSEACVWALRGGSAVKRLAAVVVIVLVALLTGVAGSPTQPAEAKAKPYEVSSTEVMLQSRGTEIPATVVVPMAKGNKKFPLVVFHHGHGGSRQENGGFGRVAEALAEAGIMSIRFDFAGGFDWNGLGPSSSEPYTKLTYTTMLADSDAALQYAMRNLPVKKDRVGGFGYSEGSAITAIQAGRPFTPYRAVALLGPVAHPAELFQHDIDTYYAEAEANGFASITDPWGTTRDHSIEWFDETIQADPVGDIEYFKGRVLVLWGEAEQIIPFGEVEAYMAATEDSAKSNKLVTIPGADHGYGFYSDPLQPEIDDVLHEALVDFFKKALK